MSAIDLASISQATLDDELLGISALVRGFGGLTLNDHTLLVYLQDTTVDKSAIDAAIAAAVGRSQTELANGAGKPIEYRAAPFLFEDLYRGRLAIDNGGLGGLIYTDVDERSNRIEVGVTDISARERLLDFAGRSATISPAALRVVILPRPKPLSDSLNGNVRPAINGVRISRQDGGSTKICTLGANVVLIGSPDAFFVTNSHCTKKMVGLDTPSSATIWYQPFVGFGDSLAVTDHADPTPFSGGSCPAGKVCRWSDAALLKYVADGAAWGGGVIALPHAGGAIALRIFFHTRYRSNPYDAHWQSGDEGRRELRAEPRNIGAELYHVLPGLGDLSSRGSHDTRQPRVSMPEHLPRPPGDWRRQWGTSVQMGLSPVARTTDGDSPRWGRWLSRVLQPGLVNQEGSWSPQVRPSLGAGRATKINRLPVADPTKAGSVPIVV